MPSVETQCIAADTSPRIRDLITDFLTAKRVAGLSPRTVEAYTARLTRFADWLGDNALTRATVRSYVASMQTQHPPLAPATIAAYARDVNVFCGWLVSEGLADSNPATKLVPKIPKRKPASYTLDQLQALLVECDDRDYALLLTLLDTGLRASELCSMRWDKLDLTTGRFTVIGKGNKERTAYLSPHTLNAIKRYLLGRCDMETALWIGWKGPLTISGVHQIIKRRAQEAGIRAHVRRLVHAFRATFAKHYVRQGGDLESLRRLLGHESIEMSAHYAQLADDELESKKHQINPLALVIGVPL